MTSFPHDGQVEFDPETVDETASGSAPAGDPAADPAGDPAEAGPAPDEATAPGSAATEADVRVAELTADLQRVQAEFLNYKRRVDRDRELVQQNARFTVLSSLLPVLDDVDRAREHDELSGGFKAVAEALERVVAGQGLEKYGAPGDAFDPRFHEALMHGLSSEVETTTCDKIVQAGYRVGERVVRPAMVTVLDPAGPDSTDSTDNTGSTDSTGSTGTSTEG